jgi:hypothetical protein
MGIATQRKLAAVGPHDEPTRRAMLPIRDVSDSQILDVATAKPRAIVTPIRPKRPTLGDLITQSFFAAGAEQEASGVYHETEHVKIRSLDHVPRRWWPTMIALCLVLGAATAGAWYLGFRPPATWQTSRAWQALHLPSMPPPAHPRWML